MRLKFFGFLLLTGFLLSAGYSCKNKKEVEQLIRYRDLAAIIESGELVALTLSGSTSYFIYKGEEMGYEYELLKGFTDSKKIKLSVKVVENENRLVEMLQEGEGDIIAYNIPITNALKEEILYCGREVINEQVLIQRDNTGDTILNDVTEMIGKEVWVLENTKYYNRLVNLDNELGGGIIIRDIERDTISVEDLIGLVAEGTIPYTVSDLDIARLNRTYHFNIDIDLAVSHPQRASWAVNQSSTDLADAVNEWFEENSNTPNYQAVLKRYFETSKWPGEERIVLLEGGNRISQYDEIFKRYAPQIDWDWRLLASIAFQESRFRLRAESWAGAVGLMGLMPRTAEGFGISSRERVLAEPSVKASVGFIKSLQRSFRDITDKEEQVKFILAAYNAGIAHILDGQALARKYGKNPHVWEGNVEECIKWKRLPEFYNDSAVKYGYFRGTETLNYVTHVVDRWRYYQEKVQ